MASWRPTHSVCTAYMLWLFGGWGGLHHFYLGRHAQAIVWCVLPRRRPRFHSIGNPNKKTSHLAVVLPLHSSKRRPSRDRPVSSHLTPPFDPPPLWVLCRVTTGGMFGFGLLRDLFRIPAYVRQANGKPTDEDHQKEYMRLTGKPTVHGSHVLAMMVVGTWWGGGREGRGKEYACLPRRRANMKPVCHYVAAQS